MKIYKNFEIKDKNERIITIGNFDGVHIGHMTLIKKTIELSKKYNQKSCVLTFKINSDENNNKKAKYICNDDEKIKIFQQMGIDELFIIEFNDSIKNTTAKDFIKEILMKKLNISNLVLGDDALLGSDRLDIKGIDEISSKMKISLTTMPEIMIDDKRVTSSLIRDMIANGVVGSQLKKYLGRDYVISGEVVHGNKIGNILGFPTANLNVDKNKVLPKYGVYHGVCEIDGKKYNAGINVGDKPTVKNSYFSIEAFLIDFDGDIYGKNINITLKEYIRTEKKFDSMELLKEQISKDIEKIMKNTLSMV